MKTVSAANFILLTAILLLASCAPLRNELPDKKEAEAETIPLSQAELAVLKKMGGDLLPDGNIKFGDIVIHRREKEISFPAHVNMTAGDLEVLICMPHGRAHESLLVSSAEPLHLQIALYLIGAENGRRLPPQDSASPPQGTILNIDIRPENGTRVPVEKWLFNKKSSAEMEREGWVFVGSSYGHNMQCLAKEEGNLVNIWSFGNTILDNPASTGDIDDFIVVNAETVPAYKTPVSVFLSIRPVGAEVRQDGGH